MRVLGQCTCLLALALSAATAQAQPPAPAPAPTPAPEPPAPPPAAPPIIRAYALIKPTFIVTSAAVESFGQPNASASTAAGNPVLAAMADEPATTWQAAQSRIGFWFDEKGPVRGHLEFDFIDFTKASPTTGALPRLRIANVDWQLSDSLLLAAGQDWDLFSPVNGYTHNLVGVAFQAGNTGFMRQQVKLIWKNESLELGGALGLPAANNAARFGVPELTQTPSLALRGTVMMGAAGRVGVSAIASRWRFAPGAATERYAVAGAANLFGDVTPVAGFNIRFEAYYGQNLANLGALSLGQGNATDDIAEVGGFLSAKYNLTDAHAVYMLAGMAKVLDDDLVLPSYAYANPPMDGSAPPITAAAASGTGPGITSNLTARLGYEYRYSKSLALQMEGFFFSTEHVLDPTFDTARFDAERTAGGAEIGLFFTL